MRERSIVLLFSVALLLTALQAVEVVSGNTDTVYLLSTYWGSRGERVIVAPGDMFVKFTVVLSSGYDTEVLTGVIGTLELPEGIRSTRPESPRVATSFLDRKVMPGDTFELTFVLDLSALSRRGSFSGALYLSYTITGDGRKSQAFNVPIEVEGRPKITIDLSRNVVQSGTEATLELRVINEGTMPASRLRVELSTLPQDPLVIIGQRVYQLDALRPNEALPLPIRVFVESNTVDLGSSISVRAYYFDPMGNAQVTETLLGVRVIRAPLNNIDLRLWFSGDPLTPGRVGEVTLNVQNVGTSEAYSLHIRFEQNPHGIAPADESATIYLSRVGAQEEVRASLKFRSPKSTLGGTYLIPVVVTYKDSLGNQAIRQFTASLTVRDSEPERQGITVSTDGDVVSGRPQDLKLKVRNRTGTDVKELSIQLTAGPGLQLIGRSDYFIEYLRSDEEVTLPLTMYAFTNAVGTASSLTLRAQYVKSGTGEVKIETTTIGLLIRGFIRLSVHSLEIRTIGEATFLTGELINEGNTPSLFTRITFVPDDPRVTVAETYIGEVSSNTLIPFNLVVTGLSPGRGQLSGKLVVTYKNEFREDGLYSRESTVSYLIEVRQRSEEQSGFPIQSLIIGTVALAIVLGVLALRRKRRGPVEAQ